MCSHTISAEHLAIGGLDPDFLGNIAGFSGLDSRDVLDFAGIWRPAAGTACERLLHRVG